MIRRPPRSTRTDTLFPYTTLFPSREAKRSVQRCQRLPGGVAFDFQGNRVRARRVAHDRRDPHTRRRDASYAGNVARAVDAVPEQVEADPDVAHAGRGEGAGDVVDEIGRAHV